MIPRSEGLEILRMSSGIKVSTLPYRTLPYRTLSLTALDPNPRPDLTLTQTVVTSAISRSASAGGGALLARILRASYTPKPNPTQVELQDLTKGELLSYPLDAIPPSRDASLETLVLPASPRDNDDDEALAHARARAHLGSASGRTDSLPCAASCAASQVHEAVLGELLKVQADWTSCPRCAACPPHAHRTHTACACALCIVHCACAAHVACLLQVAAAAAV